MQILAKAELALCFAVMHKKANFPAPETVSKEQG